MKMINCLTLLPETINGNIPKRETPFAVIRFHANLRASS